MTAETILADVGRIVRDVLDNEDLVVVRSTSAKDVLEWDSLSHVQLVVAVERFFKIRFASSEIVSFSNVGEMCDAIEAKLKSI